MLTRKTFIIVGTLATVAVIGATTAVLRQPELSTLSDIRESAFPAMRDDPAAAAKIEVRSHETSFRLERGPDGTWFSPDRFGYRVADDKIRELVVELADMKLVDAMTAKPERFAKLEVEDVDQEGAKSIELKVSSGDSKVLAEAIFGKRVYRDTGGKENGIYLRRPADGHAWLAAGGAKLDQEVVDWLDPTIVKLAAERIQKIEVEPIEGESFALSRESAESVFVMADLPEGRSLDTAEAERLAGGLSGLSLQDVASREDQAWPENAYRVRYWTFNGLEVALDIADIEEESWIRVTARASSAAEGSETDSAEGVHSEADEINGRTGAWSYKVQDYAAKRFRKGIEDLLEKVESTS